MHPSCVKFTYLHEETASNQIHKKNSLCEMALDKVRESPWEDNSWRDDQHESTQALLYLRNSEEVVWLKESEHGKELVGGV